MANHIAHHRAGAKGSQTTSAPGDAPAGAEGSQTEGARAGAKESGDPATRRPSRENLSAWWFPDLEGPDLSTEVIPGQHEALKLLNGFSISELFAEETESELGDDAEDLTPAPDDSLDSKVGQPGSIASG
ncbi:hypothetical protein [Nocardioides currus]|uniref:Uncharacterized protein n=1 Tax=Nocardioides currus TaxID=2133958 RepID=A0A2R7YRB4_9ACTN|nr:hypothetical protein [Nocardioides currus]PUA78940.1 hypothetical protein C7S10_21805 [Nocardioides currus]